MKADLGQNPVLTSLVKRPASHLLNTGIIFDKSPQKRCGDICEILTVLMNQSYKFVISQFSIGDLVTLVTMYYCPILHLVNHGITSSVGHDVNCMRCSIWVVHFDIWQEVSTRHLGRSSHGIGYQDFPIALSHGKHLDFQVHKILSNIL